MDTLFSPTSLINGNRERSDLDVTKHLSQVKDHAKQTYLAPVMLRNGSLGNSLESPSRGERGDESPEPILFAYDCKEKGIKAKTLKMLDKNFGSAMYKPNASKL